MARDCFCQDKWIKSTLMKRIWVVIGLLFLFSRPLLAGEVAIQEAKLVGIGSGYPHLQVELKGLFFPSMKEVLMEGIPIAVHCEISINRDRAVLWDSALWKGVYTRVFRYNLLTKVFEIHDPPEVQKSFPQFDSFGQEAKVFLLPLPSRPLKEQEAYIEVKVYRKSSPLFFPLNLISFLLPPAPADFETDTVRVEVHR
jgi:hypothetical protein